MRYRFKNGFSLDIGLIRAAISITALFLFWKVKKSKVKREKLKCWIFIRRKIKLLNKNLQTQ
jgi:hypothetical protein